MGETDSVIILLIQEDSNPQDLRYFFLFYLKSFHIIHVRLILSYHANNMYQQAVPTEKYFLNKKQKNLNLLAVNKQPYW